LKSRRLKPVAKIAQERENDAALALSEYRKVVDQHDAKLIELRHYHEEYIQRLNEAGRIGMNIAQINDYRSFIACLAIAVKQQEALLLECDQQLQAKNAAWIQLRGRHQALDKVIDRYHQQEGQTREKREQAESDERAQHTGKNYTPE